MITIDGRQIDHYWTLAGIQTIEPFGNGHINDTYLVKTKEQPFILQRVNKKVFRTPQLVSNYELLVRGVQEYQEKSGIKLTPNIFKTKSGVHHYIDDEHYAWRLVEFIEGTLSYEISPDPEISYRAAKTVGSYQKFLNTIDPGKPCETIKGFHNLPARLKQFGEAVELTDPSTAALAGEEIQKIRSYDFIQEEARSAMEGLETRVTHNDTKLNNVLFKGDQCFIIDLDTVMKGYIMFDFGDMVRSFTSPASEDEKNIHETRLRVDHFEALTRGYLETLRDDLSQKEKESLIIGALCIIYEQAVRFLSDYLQGNKYYKVAYPEHNLVRTRTQLKLLETILTERKKLQDIVKLYDHSSG